jgi:hypothetical protein
MTNISVDLGALAHSAARAQDLGKATADHARAVQSVLAHLDIEIKAREHFDRQLGAASRDLSSQAQTLQRHSGFLTHAAAEYERAERSVVGASREFDGRYLSESTADLLRGWFKGAWGALIAGGAVANPELLGSLLSGGWNTWKSVLLAAGGFAKFFNKMPLASLDFLFRNMTGGLRLNPNIMLWTMRYANCLKVAVMATAVISGVIDGVNEFRESAGSFARRVSDGVVVGGAKGLAGLAGAKVGLVIGGTIGTAIGTPVGGVIGAAAGVVLGAAIGWGAAWVAEQAVNYGGDYSVKARIGDYVDHQVANVKTMAALGSAQGGTLGGIAMGGAYAVTVCANPIAGMAVSQLVDLAPIEYRVADAPKPPSGSYSSSGSSGAGGGGYSGGGGGGGAGTGR